MTAPARNGAVVSRASLPPHHPPTLSPHLPLPSLTHPASHPLPPASRLPPPPPPPTGMDAGHAYNTWPLMSGQLVPLQDYCDWERLGLSPLRNLFENTAAVQFNHRWAARRRVYVPAPAGGGPGGRGLGAGGRKGVEGRLVVCGKGIGVGRGRDCRLSARCSLARVCFTTRAHLHRPVECVVLCCW